MLFTTTLISFVLVFGQEITPKPGSKLAKGLSDYLPNFAEMNLVITISNTYMQASGFVRAINGAVSSMNNAVDALKFSKQTAEQLWGDVQKLKDLNIYDMDSWANTIDHVQYNIISGDMRDLNSLLLGPEGVGWSLLDGTLGGVVNAQNALTYDARDANLKKAFNAYYYNQDWADYLAQDGVKSQTQVIKDKMAERDAISQEKASMDEFVCPSYYTKETCDRIMQQVGGYTQYLETQMDNIDNDIDGITGHVAVSSLRKDEGYMQLDYLETVLKRIQFSSADYAKAYENINNTSSQIARRVQKMLTGRITTPERDPQPKPASAAKAPNAAELCADPANQQKNAKGEMECIYSDDDNNKMKPPEDEIRRYASTADGSVTGEDDANEKPRDLSMADFQEVKTHIAYVNMLQEQLLFDIEMDQAYLDLVMKARKVRKTMDHRRKIGVVNENLGLAIVIQQAYGETSDNIRKAFNKSVKVYTPWDVTKPLEANVGL